MRTEEQFIAEVHLRADKMRRARAKRFLVIRAALCLAGFLVLTVLAFSPHTLPITEMMTGSSLLGESAGGYVLTAVIAFMAGASLVAYFKWRQEQQKNGQISSGLSREAAPEHDTTKDKTQAR